MRCESESCDHEHSVHRSDTGACRYCNCGSCACATCSPPSASTSAMNEDDDLGCGCPPDCETCGDECECPDGCCCFTDGDGVEEENPAPASKTEDADVPFSAQDAARMLDILVTMEQAGIIAQGIHRAPRVRNLYEDLKTWDRDEVGPPRYARGEEIYPAVWGYGWEQMREAVRQLDEILFDPAAPFHPRDRLRGNESRADQARFKLMKDMSWMDDLWRKKLGMARVATLIRYGRGD